MFREPCKDHDHCWLDLGLLRADLRDMAARQRALNKKRKAAKPEDPYLFPRAAPQRLTDGERPVWIVANNAYLLLYALRAAHRGKVHRIRERIHDVKGHIETRDLAHQATLLERYGAWLKEAYGRKVAVKRPEQTTS